MTLLPGKMTGHRHLRGAGGSRKEPRCWKSGDSAQRISGSLAIKLGGGGMSEGQLLCSPDNFPRSEQPPKALPHTHTQNNSDPPPPGHDKVQHGNFWTGFSVCGVAEGWCGRHIPSTLPPFQLHRQGVGGGGARPKKMQLPPPSLDFFLGGGGSGVWSGAGLSQGSAFRLSGIQRFSDSRWAQPLLSGFLTERGGPQREAGPRLHLLHSFTVMDRGFCENYQISHM